MPHPARTCFTASGRRSLEPPDDVDVDEDDVDLDDEDDEDTDPAEERRWWQRLPAWMQSCIPEPPKEPRP